MSSVYKGIVGKD
jgi:P-type Ca2+ transporter type 2C